MNWLTARYICITDGHGYNPNLVFTISSFFLHSRLIIEYMTIIGFVTCLIEWVSLFEQEPLTLLDYVN